MSSQHFDNYLNEIAKVSLLTHQEEIQLGTIIQQNLGSAVPELQAACEEAVVKLVGANLRLVVKCANYYRFTHHDIEELTAEGNRGLMTAAKKYDPTKGTRFSTYATWWIQQSIRNAVNGSHTVRTPIRRASQLAKIMMSNAYDPDHEEQDIAKLSQETNIDQEEVVKLLKYRTQLVPMDAPIPGDDAGATLQSALPSGEASADAHLMDAELVQKLKTLVMKLPDQKRQVVTLRFGLDNQPVQTLEAIAQVLNITRERIRKIQLEGIRMLQDELQKLGYNISPEALINLNKPGKQAQTGEVPAISEGAASSNPVPARAKRSPSAATRSKIAASQKAYWARVRADKPSGKATTAAQPQPASPQTAEIVAESQSPAQPEKISAQMHNRFIEVKEQLAAAVQKLHESRTSTPLVEPKTEAVKAETTAPKAKRFVSAETRAKLSATLKALWAKRHAEKAAQPAEYKAETVKAETATPKANHESQTSTPPAEPKAEAVKAETAAPKAKRFVSAETRAKISANRRAQEAAKRAKLATTKPATDQVQETGKAMPLERRLRISATMKARWTRRRAEKAAQPAATEETPLLNAA